MQFAVDNAALFRVMFGPELRRNQSPALDSSSRAAFQILVDAAREAVAAENDSGSEYELPVVTTAAWAVVHGLAMLWLDGQIREVPGGITKLAERVTALLSQALERDRGLPGA